MAVIHPDDLRVKVQAAAGPEMQALAAWASGELWRRLERVALEEGLYPPEATVAAQYALLGMLEALAGAIGQAKWDRLFRRSN